jgi:hypothetical protein
MQQKTTNHLSYGNNCKPRCDDGQAQDVIERALGR